MGKDSNKKKRERFSQAKNEMGLRGCRLPQDIKILELIKRRRRQLVVHSIIYYRLNDSIITDKQFDMWARELVKLQKEYPDLSKEVELYEDFQDWDGTTGFNLKSLMDPRMTAIASQLLSTSKRLTDYPFIIRDKKKLIIKF